MILEVYQRKITAQALSAACLMGAFVRKRTRYVNENDCTYTPSIEVIQDTKLIHRAEKLCRGNNSIPLDIPLQYVQYMPPLIKHHMPIQWVDDLLSSNPKLEITMLAELYRKKLTISLPYSAIYSFLYDYFTYFKNENGVCEYFIYDRKGDYPGDKVYKIDPFYM